MVLIVRKFFVSYYRRDRVYKISHFSEKNVKVFAVIGYPF